MKRAQRSLSQTKAVATLLLAVLPLCSARAQSTVELGAPSSRFPEPFSRVAQVAELADGRLVVLDNLENSVQVVDSALRTSRTMIRAGSGPGELQRPAKFLPVSDGSTVVVDRANSRMLRISADGKTIAEWPRPASNGCLSASGWRPLLFQFVDDNQRFYRDLPPIRKNSRGIEEIAPSAPIVAFKTPCSADTIARIAIRNASELIVMNGVSVFPKDEPVFPRNPQWTLARNGNIVVVEAEPFQVHIIDSRGFSVDKTISYEPLEVTAAHKAAWREKKNARGITTVTSRDGSPMSVALMASPWSEPKSWPKTLPPFLENALIPAADGTVWIKRTTAAGAATQYDVLSATGDIVAHISLNSKGRVVAVGRRYVYSARTDADGAEWLERNAYSLGAQR